jgi:2-beta-glucuronyltransferase
LPMIGPKSICDPDVPSLIGYTPGSEASMAEALDTIDGMSRGPSDPLVEDWSLLYERIVSTPKPSS